jgi:rhodanese-related sulfurtransferase
VQEEQQMDITTLSTRDDVQVVDVREQDEWSAGHISGARHIPLGQLTSRVGELDPQHPIAVVCRSGSRSSRAVAALVAAGLPAQNVDGGMAAWAGSGLPVTTDDGRPGHVL